MKRTHFNSITQTILLLELLISPAYASVSVIRPNEIHIAFTKGESLERYRMGLYQFPFDFRMAGRGVLGMVAVETLAQLCGYPPSGNRAAISFCLSVLLPEINNLIFENTELLASRADQLCKARGTRGISKRFKISMAIREKLSSLEEILIVDGSQYTPADFQRFSFFVGGEQVLADSPVANSMMMNMTEGYKNLFFRGDIPFCAE